MILEVQNGCFGYPKQPVILENINLRLEEGHILAILGPNGIGKTTLLKCMIGLLPWHSGKTLFMGRTSTPSSRRMSGVPSPTFRSLAASLFPTPVWKWFCWGAVRISDLSATRQRGNRNGGSHDGTSGDHPSCQQGLQPDERR